MHTPHARYTPTCIYEVSQVMLRLGVDFIQSGDSPYYFISRLRPSTKDTRVLLSNH